jgi:hypothetical protein
MNPHAQRLDNRLSAIAAALAQRGDALGLLGLGSVGQELSRADAYSDLDFFVIVRPSTKPAYLNSLDWLAAARPLVWSFANTPDGHKALMDDGLMCEFAVFEPDELLRATYTPGRWIWRRDEVPTNWDTPRVALPKPADADWLFNEALSNLLVGMLRFRRGEKLAAMRMVQVYALDRVLQWIDQHEEAQTGVSRDPFSVERRFEARHPQRADTLAQWAPGIEGTPLAALALLNWICARHSVPSALEREIRRLLQITA